MNVLVVNRQDDVLSSLNIEIIKTLRGTFSAEEIISTFTNFFFARMIIDITALQNSDDVATYQKLSIGLPVDKVILLIPSSSTVANNYFLSKLISMGFYNFTTNADGVMYLLNRPNTYKDVAHLHQIGQSNFVPNVNTDAGGSDDSFTGIRTLGIKNVTDGTGATTLVYMMKKELEEKHNLSVLAIEVGKRDFAFFNEKNMISTDKGTLATELLKAKNYNYILVDLNDYEDNICDEMIYLIEPSILKLNKLMLRDRNIFSKLKDKKVVMNRCVLGEADVKEFASEAGIKLFAVIPPLNDREPSKEVSSLLAKLGLIKNLDV